MDKNDPVAYYSTVTPKMILPLLMATHQQIRSEKSKKLETFSSTTYKNQVILEQEENTKKQGAKSYFFFFKTETEPSKK